MPLMDAVLVDNLTHFTPLKTWISGQLFASQGRSLLPYLKSRSTNHFQARKIQLADFMIADSCSNVRVIKALDGQLLTEQALLKPKVLDGKIIADVERDILWLVD